MASATYEDFILIDNFPASGNPGLVPPPQDGFDGELSHNVLLPWTKPGTKCTVYDETAYGWTTLMYGKASGNLTLGMVCCPVTGVALYTTMAVCTAADGASGMCGIAVKAITTAYHGWFWIGGVCPRDPKLLSAATAALLLAVDSAVNKQAAGQMDAGVLTEFAGTTSLPCGYSLNTP